MKTLNFLKWIDLIGQTIILTLFPLLVVVGSPRSSGVFPESVGYVLVVTGYFLGPWQMVSSFLSILVTSAFRKDKIKHFLFAVCYLVTLFSVASTARFIPDTIIPFLVALAFIVPAALAAYYYFITWKWALKNEPTGNFLRHISF